MNKENKEASIVTTDEILIIDDSRPLQRLIIKALSLTPYPQVDIARNGEEGLKKIQEKEKLYRAVLLDLHMPVMGGEDVIEKIRAMKGDKSQTIVLAITGNHAEFTLEQFKALGFNGVFTKPIDFTELIGRLKDLPAPNATAWVN